MRIGKETTPLALSDLGISSGDTIEYANNGYVRVRDGEIFPGSVTQTINGELSVMARVARAARARFESTGAPVYVVEAHDQAPAKPSGSA